MSERHEHQWIYEYRSCCYVLRCIVPGCEKVTKVYHTENDEPITIGSPVAILEDGVTMQRIGSPFPHSAEVIPFSPKDIDENAWSK